MIKTLEYNGVLFESYTIDTSGVVRSIDRLEQCGKTTRKRKGRPIKLNPDKDGYLTCILYDRGKQTFCRVHRAVACTFLIFTEDDLEVNHVDEDKSNNNLTNLEWVTSKQNSQHSKHKQAGDKHPTRKLSVAQVEEIKEKLKDFKRGDCTKLAREYRVTKHTISKIKTGVNHAR